MRSNGLPLALQVATLLGDGAGGHEMAAGGVVKLPYAMARERILSAVAEVLDRKNDVEAR